MDPSSWDFIADELRIFFSCSPFFFIRNPTRAQGKFQDIHFLPFLFVFSLVYSFLYPVYRPLSTYWLFSFLGGWAFFSQPLSTLYVIVAATVGGSLIFLAARYALGNFLYKKGGKTLQKINRELKENGGNYLFFLRIIPLFPFWLVNIAPAFINMRLWTFLWTTFLGIIPGTFVLTQAGTGLGSILSENEPLSLSSIFNWQVKIALLAIALFSLLPLIIKKLRKNK